MCNELRIQILEDFSLIGKVTNKEKLREACLALDAIGERAVNDLRVWFCQHMLKPYEEHFGPNKPEAGLEHTKRRFAWFKRFLKEATSGSGGLFEIFPDYWQM